MLHLTRRRLLGGLSHGLAALFFVPAAVRAFCEQDSSTLELGLEGWIADSPAARTIGDAYLAEAANAGRRTRALARALERLPDAASRRRLLGERRERDLSTDDIVVVDGWVLAATEAQLCALSRIQICSRRG